MSLSILSKQNLGFCNKSITGQLPYSYMKKNNEINEIWDYFMKAFELDEYYKEEKIFNELKFKSEGPSRITAIKLINEFLVKNKISYTDKFNLISSDSIKDTYNEEYNKISYLILTNAKIWIMFIIVMSKIVEISDVFRIFENALASNVDSVFLFEFFLIYLSKSDTEIIRENLNSKCMLKGREFWPVQFIKIYNENKSSLDEIFDLGKSQAQVTLCTSSICKENDETHFTQNMTQATNEINDYSLREDNYDHEFSFFQRDDIDIDIGTDVHIDMDIDKIDEEKLKILIDQDTLLMENLMNDDLILNSKSQSEKSPSISLTGNSNNKIKQIDNFSKNNSENNDSVSNENVITKSPCLDNYLIPDNEKELNNGNGNAYNDRNSTDDDISPRLNLVNALKKINLKNESDKGYYEEEYIEEDYNYKDSDDLYELNPSDLPDCEVQGIYKLIPNSRK